MKEKMEIFKGYLILIGLRVLAFVSYCYGYICGIFKGFVKGVREGLKT